MRQTGKTIGLTGGIASGKSTVAGYLVDAGALLLDLDRLAHETYEPGQKAYGAIVAYFGDGILTKERKIDRAKLAGVVFKDSERLQKLNSIVWPEVIALSRSKIAELRAQDPHSHIVVEAALLVEARAFDRFDELWVVTVDHDIALERLLKRSKFSETEARARLASQTDNATRTKVAHRVIDNNGTLKQLKAQTLAHLQSLGS